MTFIGATKAKHIAADQIKTAFRFSFNATWSNAPTTLTKENNKKQKKKKKKTKKKQQHYLTSYGAVLKQRHVNKQEDDFSLVLQWKYIDKKEIS